MNKTTKIRETIARIPTTNRSQHIKIKQALSELLDLVEPLLGSGTQKPLEISKEKIAAIKPEPAPKVTYSKTPKKEASDGKVE